MTVVERHKTRGSTWQPGEALFWKNDGGVHCYVMVSAVERTTRGRITTPGEMATIHAPTLKAVNDALHGLGLGRTSLRLRDIKVAS